MGSLPRRTAAEALRAPCGSLPTTTYGPGLNESLMKNGAPFVHWRTLHGTVRGDRVGLTVCPRRSPSQSSGGWVGRKLVDSRGGVCHRLADVVNTHMGNLILCEVSCGETPRDHRVRCLKRL